MVLIFHFILFQWRSNVADNQFFRSRATEGPYAQEARDIHGKTLKVQSIGQLRERQRAFWFDHRPPTEKVADYHLLPDDGEELRHRPRRNQRILGQSQQIQGMNSAGVFVGRPTTPEKERAIRQSLVLEQKRLAKEVRVSPSTRP